MPNVIKHKNNSTPGAVPGTGSLSQAELAINIGDGRLYTKNANNTIINLPVTSISGTTITPASGYFSSGVSISGISTIGGITTHLYCDGDFVYIKYSNGNTLYSSEEGIFTDINNIPSINYINRHLYGTGLYNAGSPLLSWGENDSIGIKNAFPNYTLDVNGSGNFVSGLYVSGVSVSLSGHTHLSSDITNFNTAVSGLVSGVYVPNTRTITPGSGLVGSTALDLSSNRTLDVGAGDGITVSANSIAVDSTVVRTNINQTISGILSFDNFVILTPRSSSSSVFIGGGDPNNITENDFGLIRLNGVGEWDGPELVFCSHPDYDYLDGSSYYGNVVFFTDALGRTGFRKAIDTGSSSVVSRLVFDVGDNVTSHAGYTTTLASAQNNKNVYLTLPSTTGNIALTNDILAFFTPNDNQPPATNAATTNTRNRISILEFDANTEESAFFVGVLPNNVDLTNGIRVRLWWMAATATSGNVRWAISFERVGTDNDADSFSSTTQANGTAQGTSGVERVTTITATSANIDGLIAGERYRLRVARIAADATNDTMLGDAQLVCVEVKAA